MFKPGNFVYGTFRFFSFTIRKDYTYFANNKIILIQEKQSKQLK